MQCEHYEKQSGNPECSPHGVERNLGFRSRPFPGLGAGQPKPVGLCLLLPFILTAS